MPRLSRPGRRGSSALQAGRKSHPADKRAETGLPPARPQVSKTAETLPDLLVAAPATRRRTPSRKSSPRKTPVAEPSTPPAAPAARQRSARAPAATPRARTDPASLVGGGWSFTDEPLPPIDPRQTPEPGTTGYSMVVPRGVQSLPTLEKYLARLPDGLDSYPTVSAKGLTVRTLLQDPIHPIVAAGGLPDALAHLVHTPPGADSWVPLVWLLALQAIAFDRVFGEGGGTAAYEEWMFQRNLRLLRMPGNREVLDVPRPALLFSANTTRWSAFYRGTTLSFLEGGKGRATFRLAHPAHCFHAIGRIGLGAAFRAAAIVAGAKTATASVVEESTRGAKVDIGWT